MLAVVYNRCTFSFPIHRHAQSRLIRMNEHIPSSMVTPLTLTEYDRRNVKVPEYRVDDANLLCFRPHDGYRNHVFAMA
jgi:hypothetical protein